METVNVRYIVNDAEEAKNFYRDRLAFKVEMNPAPGFVMLSRGSFAIPRAG